MSLELFLGEALFLDAPLWAVACIAVSYFLGFFIRGTFGFGSNIPIVLLTTPILGPHHAIVLTAFASFIAQIDLLPQGLRTADWKVSKPLIAGMLAGTAAGTWLLTLWKAEWLEISMGLLIIAIIGMERLQLMERLSERFDLRSRRITSTLAVGTSCRSVASHWRSAAGSNRSLLTARATRFPPAPRWRTVPDPRRASRKRPMRRAAHQLGCSQVLG